MRNLLILLFSIVILAGCQSYREGGSRTVGELTDDVGVSTAVKTALVRHPEVNGFRINVDVKRGVVSLYGPVPSTYARQKVVEVVSGVRGVREVQDKLTIVEPN